MSPRFPTPRPLTLLLCLLVSLHCPPILAFDDPLDHPAEASSLASAAPLFAEARAGDRIVAVGARGIVIYSDTSGKDWRQARVPVSADLTGVSFPSPKYGWAVGHGGVILHTSDGGVTWAKQLDGRSAGTLARQYYETAAKIPDAGRAAAILEQARGFEEEKEAQPFLDAWFMNEKTGFVAGTFNRLFRTDDGGERWVPLLDKVDNPQALHFYAVRGLGKEVFLAGEQGCVWRWDENKGRFLGIPTPYKGSLFGLVVTPRIVLAFGMRGSLFRTLDRGVHWEKIPTNLRSGIVAGDVRANGDIVLLSQSGETLISSGEGAAFRPLVLPRPAAAVAIVSAADGAFVLAGPTGIRVEKP